MPPTGHHAIFLSYRRDDAQANAGRLFDWLARQFGREQIFLDTEKIAAGEEFPRELEKRLSASDVVLAVIGPRWLSMSDENGQRRLDHPRDYVRREIAQALAQNKRIIPVLVGGTPMPAADTLPEPLKPLASRNAVKVGDATFERDFDILVDEILGRPRNFIRRELDRLQRLVFVAKRLSIVVPLLVIVLLLAAWMRTLDAFGLDTQAATYVLWASELVSGPRGDPQVILATIDAETEREFGRPFSTAHAAQWREDHARLIERAAAAGAAAVVFDLFFESKQPAADTTLASATQRALASAGTRVVFGVRTALNGKPALVEEFAEAGGWGSLCLVRRLGYTFLAPLAVLMPGAGGGDLARANTPGLALAAVSRHALHSVDLNRGEIRLDGPPSELPLRFSTIDRIRWEYGACRTLSRGNDVAMLLVRPAPPGYWRSAPRAWPYAELLDPRRTPEAQLKGAILLVGLTALTDPLANPDEHEIVRGFTSRKVYGVELHADVIASLLTGDVIAFASADLQAVTMSIMALMGAAASVLNTSLSRGRRRLVTTAVVAAYLLAAVALSAANLLLNILYDLAAFLAAYALLRWLQRRALGEIAFTELQ
jgi:CHASE2 domain-containing sensor protein